MIGTGGHMKSSHRVLLAALVLVLAIPVSASAQQPSLDRRVGDIVQAGKIRIGLHLPQFVNDPATGEIQGQGTGKVIVAIAQALGTQLGVKLELVGHASPPKLMECLQAQACDAGFLGFVPGRTGDVGFTPPYIMVPFTLMVPASSSIRSIVEVDKTGVRIAAVRNHASTLALRRVVKQAEIVDVEIPDEAFELLRNGRADAWASPRPPLLEYAPKLTGARVLDGRYGENLQSMAVPKDQAGRLAYISEFLEVAKASGLVQRAIERAGEHGMEVAPTLEAPVVTGTVSGAAR
jgi:polar amino acid transport system substrate-binding protein